MARKKLELKDLTKAQLLELIEKLCEGNSYIQHRVAWHLSDLRFKSAMRDIDESDRLGDEWLALERQYNELMEPYAGKKLREIPEDVLDAAASLAKKIKTAKERYMKTLEG